MIGEKFRVNQNILVTGGSGLVGKHLKEIIPDATYISSKDYDLTDLQQTKDMMLKCKPNVVIHLAARVGGILDNMTHPVDYLEQNINVQCIIADHWKSLELIKTNKKFTESV